MSTKTTMSTATFVEFTKEFTFAFYQSSSTYSVGQRVKIQNRDLCNEGYRIVLGHGIDQIVPWDYFKLVRVTTERTITETFTENELARPTF